MKKAMKLKWTILAVLFGLIIISSCKKNFLDRQPLGRYIDSDIPKGSFDSKVFALYALLRANGFNDHLYLAIENFRSDMAEKGSSQTDGASTGLMYDEFQYNKSDGSIQEYWTSHYAVIIAANAIIHDIDSLNLSDPNTLINKGEAEFLRAYTYFHLVRTFGEVPMFTTKITDAAQVNVPKSPVSTIFEQIDKDAQDAAAVLPVQWDPQYIGRLTKGAAMTLQTKAALWRKNWAGALGFATAVINSNQYSLVKDYQSQFRKTGENGPESIFEIQAYYTPTQNLGIIYANVQGVRGAGQWDLGWGWNVPTQKLVDEFETGDPRKDATILYSGQNDPIFGQLVPSYPAVVPRPYWNMKIYTNPVDRQSLNNRFGPWMNHRLYRYSDVLLMAAEAANELGGVQNTTDALEWLEMVRARARGNNAGILPAVTTTDQGELRNAIRHERAVELGMEEQRFWDLVRWGIDVTVLPSSGSPGYLPKNRLLPLPQGEVDKSGGVLIQNPDYQ